MSHTSISQSLQDMSAVETGTPEDSKHTEANIVDWDAVDDAAKPANWPGRKMWTHIILVAVLGLISNMATTMCAPGIDFVIADFNITSQAVSKLAVTIYLLGLALGPLFLSSLSEVYGRLPVYHVANLVFVAFLIGNALSQNTAQFVVFRFLSGCAGGMPLALGGGTIADVTSPAQKAAATTLFSLGPLAGPVLGPVIGSFLAASKGWRWTFWASAILGGSVEIAILVLMRETSSKILLERKAASLRITTGNPYLTSKLTHSVTPKQVLIQALVRPTVLLFQSPIILTLSLYAALIFGVIYFLFTTFDDVFVGQYEFSRSTSGLPYLGMGVALVLCVFIFGHLSPRIQATRVKAEGIKQPRPEYRLLPMIWFSPFVAVGLIIYGWTAYYRVHWIVPIISTFLVGIGAYFILMPTQLYLIELFGSESAASALSGYNLLRYLGGTFLPLAGPSLYKTLHYGWGNTLLGFIALGFVLVPVLSYKHGMRLRARDAIDG